ncbi:hypothetical protein MPSEU_000012100 [Mayamaea pseudoterrestris]|nr:hypothetical protein MPSEU_000012100 [Mayamaea pseudoterrestris]
MPSPTSTARVYAIVLAQLLLLAASALVLTTCQRVTTWFCRHSDKILVFVLSLSLLLDFDDRSPMPRASRCVVSAYQQRSHENCRFDQVCVDGIRCGCIQSNNNGASHIVRCCRGNRWHFLLRYSTNRFYGRLDEMAIGIENYAFLSVYPYFWLPMLPTERSWLDVLFPCTAVLFHTCDLVYYMA